MNKKIKIPTKISALVYLVSSNLLAVEYPYSLPSNMTATINVTTTSQETYNNKLLGTNIFGFTSNTEQSLFNKFDPLTVRFPHGLWANWYDWETDGTRVFGTDTFKYTWTDGSKNTQTLDHLAEIKTFESNGIKVGINGLAQLNSDRMTSSGKGFDMLWTFNMSKDGSNYNNGSPQTIAHYNDLISRGFEVKNIELGNENFYPGQRSSIIPEVSDYIKRAKSMSAALKAQDTNIKVSVPLLRRGNWANPNWNADVAKDQSYFDAVTVHTYVGSNPDDPDSGDGAFGTALTARYHLDKSIKDYAHKVAPNKPIWLTEWGVKSGGPNAVSVLGMADAYIYMSENQDIYERANWFSANGKLNSFLVWEDYVNANGVTRPRIKQPLEKSAFGSSYEIIRDVFENSTMLDSTMNSPELIDGVNAISARVVVKGNETIVFAVNLTNKQVPFNVKLDGATYNGAYNHKSMSFTWMGQETVTPMDTSPLSAGTNSSGVIMLPKLSMSKIVLSNANIPISTPTNTYVHLKKANNAGFSLDGGNGAANNQNVKIWSTNLNNVNQQWQEISRGANYYSYKKRGTQFCLDAGNNGANNQNVKLMACDHTNLNQHFDKVNRGASNNYQLKKRNATGFAIDGGNGGEKGQNVKLWSSQTGENSNQVWTFTKVN